MEKHLSYRATIARPHAVRDRIDIFVMAFSSWPRLLIEVFTRCNFGERYFSFASAMMLALFLAHYPFLRAVGLNMFPFGSYGGEIDTGMILRDNLLLYGYLIGFVYMSIQRRKEVTRIPGQFDFARYSLSTGEIDERFSALTYGGEPVSRRTIETLVEPGLFFFIGIILWAFGQSLGMILIVCALLYSWSYRAMYRMGDNFVLDQIDRLIINKEMVSSFADEADSSQTQGFYFYGRRPADPDFRRELASRMVERDEAIEAV